MEFPNCPMTIRIRKLLKLPKGCPVPGGVYLFRNEEADVTDISTVQAVKVTGKRRWRGRAESCIWGPHDISSESRHDYGRYTLVGYPNFPGLEDTEIKEE